MGTSKHLLITAGLLLASSVSLADLVNMPQGDDLIAIEESVSTQFQVDDIFAIANHININHATRGTAHIIGKQLNINAPVTHNLYALGENIMLRAPVTQDVLVIGSNIQLSENIDGELRALGETISITGRIAGDATIGGNSVHINSHIGGNLVVSASHLSFGQQARIEGTVTLYEDSQQSHDIPSSVADGNKVDRIQMDNISHYQVQLEHQQSGWQRWLGKTFILFLLALILVLLARNFMIRAAAKVNQRLGQTLLQGALSMAILIGSIPLFAITLIGLPISVLLIIATLLVGVLGAIVGAFSMGNMVWQRLRDEAPKSLLSLALICFLGVLLVNVLAAIPFIGWLISLAVLLTGVGAISPWQTKRYS
jgi:hypothetical protein